MTESTVQLRETKTLPDGWRLVKLGDIIKTDTTQVLPNTVEANQLPYVGLEHVETETGKIIGILTWKHNASVQGTAFRFDSRHVLYGKLRPYLNKVAVPDFEGRCSTELLPLLPLSTCDRLYLAWFLRRSETVAEAMRYMTGTRMPRADMDELSELPVPLPPLPEQKRIAAKVQEMMQDVERARTACEAQLEAAKALPKAYLRQVFESEEAKKWERRRLGEVCEIIMGQSPPGHTYNRSEKGMPFFQGKYDFGELYPKVSYWCTHPQEVAEVGDVLISVRAPVGPTNLCNQKCCIGRGLAAIRSAGNVESLFVLYFLRFVEKQIAEMGKGSTFGAIKRNDIERISFPFPPLNIQRRIATELQAKMEEAEKLTASIEKQLEAIRALPQAILRKAFSGEL